MNTFLQAVAASLLQKFGNQMNHVTVVFPGKRASLFLNQALAEMSPTPIWAPRYQTISELFDEASEYALADSVESVCRLYKSYSKFVDDAQSLDKFYSWGEVLLADFDDIDKHMADANRLFANVYDLRQLDDASYISKEQEKALRDFFSSFSVEATTELKERFLRLWSKMGLIYEDFRQSMRNNGVLYEGALQREVIERLRREGWDSDNTYVFVGFNVLNDVEQALFDLLQHAGKALFYWDYDIFYANNKNLGELRNEAGYFIQQNILRYGNELDKSYFDNLRQPKKTTFVAASSENIQARYMTDWLSANLTKRENETAVVLCNELLLQPVLHSISSNVRNLNVTMGFPLADTPVFSFVISLLSLQTDGYDANRNRFRFSALRAVAAHPFAQLVGEDVWNHRAGNGTELLSYLLEVLSAVGRALNQETDILYAESVFKTYTAINRLRDLMCTDDNLLDVNDQTLRRLVRSVLQSQTIPFHGEPAVGLQVLGVLETRALDFRHLLMLSVGEGFLPRATSDTSFIPYFLREAFGLTTIRHKIAVYAYYFYRLIQRAEILTFVYNESNNGVRQNEMSRFLRQLQAETDFPIENFKLQAASTPTAELSVSVQKTPEMMTSLREYYDNTGRPRNQRKFLSPSAMNTYTECPMMFYYRYVQDLRIDPDPQDGLDAILFGHVFHKAAELVYRELTSRGQIVRAQDIEGLIAQRGIALEPFVRQAFQEEFFKDQAEEYTGILIIARRVIHTYLMQLLRHDLRLTPFTVVGLEKHYTTTLHVGGMEIDTGGIIDRIDQVNDENVEGGVAVRVVDYKTGGSSDSLSLFERMFSDTGQREHYYFQTILYASIVARQSNMPVTPCLFFVHRAGAEKYSPKLKLERQTINDVRQTLPSTGKPLNQEFMQAVQSLVAEIFDESRPFTQTTQDAACQHCDFRTLCGK